MQSSHRETQYRSPEEIIYGLRHCAAQQKHACLVSFLVGQAKAGIWLTRRNKMKGTGSTDVELMFKSQVSAHIRAQLTTIKWWQTWIISSLFWEGKNVLYRVKNVLFVLSF